MSSRGAIAVWNERLRNNAVVERFFGTLKHDWILKAPRQTREKMVADVALHR